MINNKADRIQNAINHIKSSVDIDPWAMELAVEAMEKELKNSTQEVKNANDAISRQAAIDLLKQMRKDGNMIPWEGKDVFARIRKLPSAQPEDCDTCKHGYFGDDQCERCRVRYPSHYERRTDECTD